MLPQLISYVVIATYAILVFLLVMPDSRSFRQNNTLNICIISGNYGERGIEVFKELARERNVCIAESLSAPTVDGDDEFDRIIKALLKNKNASVVVCFCEGRTARRLINAMKDYPEAQGHFQILARLIL